MTDKKLSEYNRTLRFRNIVQKMASKVVNDERPGPRYGVVETVDRANNLAMVQYPDEVDPVAVPFGVSAVPLPGDIVRVEGIRGDRYIAEVKRAVGPAVDPVTELAFGMVNVNTGGICKGKWANGAGSGVTTIPVTSTDVDLNIGVQTVPVRPNRLLRISFRITGADCIGGGYLSTTLYLNWNGATPTPYRRNVKYVVGSGVVENGPVTDDWLIVTPSNATSMACKLYGVTNVGTAYYYRYATYTGQDQSQIMVEDVGSAQDFLDQGGIAG